MRLHAHTHDEREAMNLRLAGWRFKRFLDAEWELTWDPSKQGWPNEDPRLHVPPVQDITEETNHDPR